MVANNAYVYSRKLYVAERECGAMLRRFRMGHCDLIPSFTDGIDGDQIRGVDNACRHPLSLIYGNPGTGKTRTIQRVVKSFDNQHMKGLVIAPTGKAAKRSLEVLLEDGATYNSRPDCKTIWKGLGFAEGAFRYNERNPLPYDYVIAEEWSMAGLVDFSNLLLAIDPKRTRLVIVGDPYQLPSVSSGNVLYDCIMCGRIPSVGLTKIRRQGPNSGIPFNAARILRGEMPLTENPETGDKFNDFYFIPTKDENESLSKIVNWNCGAISSQRGFDSLMEIQTLSPGHKGIVGTSELNKNLRERFNPSGEKGYRDFRIGDKVINKRNNYEKNIVNGDVGKIMSINRYGMEVDFGLGGLTEIDKDMGDNIELAYAYSVHGSQGSEYPCVLIPVHRTHWRLLFQNLIYTGATRAKSLVMLVGDPTSYEHAIQNTVTDKRMTGLRNWI